MLTSINIITICVNKSLPNIIFLASQSFYTPITPASITLSCRLFNLQHHFKHHLQHQTMSSSVNKC